MKLVSSDLTHLKLKETPLLFHLLRYLRSTDLSPDHSMLSGVLFFLLLYFRTAHRDTHTDHLKILDTQIQTHAQETLMQQGILFHMLQRHIVPHVTEAAFPLLGRFQREPHAFGLGFYRLLAPAADHEAGWPFLEPLLSEFQA